MLYASLYLATALQSRHHMAQRCFLQSQESCWVDGGYTAQYQNLANAAHSVLFCVACDTCYADGAKGGAGAKTPRVGRNTGQWRTVRLLSKLYIVGMRLSGYIAAGVNALPPL